MRLRRLHGWLKDLLDEMTARREGRHRLRSTSFRSARHIVGPTGNMFSKGWERYAEGSDAFVRSFDPKVPSSIHISHRDSLRRNLVVPISERCVEDWSSGVTYTDPYDEFGSS